MNNTEGGKIKANAFNILRERIILIEKGGQKWLLSIFRNFTVKRQN